MSFLFFDITNSYDNIRYYSLVSFPNIGAKKRVRVNTISQSPTWTTPGSGVKGFKEFFDYADKMSPLGNAPAEDCANYCVTMFSDLTKYVTMQNLYHDGGFSNMGMSPALLPDVEG